MLAAAREAEILGSNPSLVLTYAGKWIVVHGGRVVASASSGRELAKNADINKHPNAVIRYVPTPEEQEGVQILCPDHTA